MTSILQLIQAIGLGLVLLLPLANPLTTVALLLGLSGNMTREERNQQSLMASVYVFFIMTVAFLCRPVGDEHLRYLDSRLTDRRWVDCGVYRLSYAVPAAKCG